MNATSTVTSPMPNTQEMDFKALSRLPSLDGWRAISIILVLGGHCHRTVGFPLKLDPLFRWVFDGDLGVRTFFIISGFLITWLMLVEHERIGRVSLWRFYARRALRILPVYVAFLCVLATLQVFTPYQQSARVWTANVTFTTNFLTNGVGWTSGHLWSLAVEEQFYLLWPSIFVLSGVARNLRTSLTILSLPICIAPVARVVSYLSRHGSSTFAFIGPLSSSYSFFNYFDSLAIGCACAMLLARKRDLIQHWMTSWSRIVVLIAFTLIIVPYVLNRWFLAGYLTPPFSSNYPALRPAMVLMQGALPLGSTCQAFGLAMILMQSVIFPRLGLYPLLNQPIICRIGVLSYSIYIWQQIFCTDPQVFGLSGVWWMSFPFWLIPVFMVATASYYGLEQPLFRLRTHLREV